MLFGLTSCFESSFLEAWLLEQNCKSCFLEEKDLSVKAQTALLGWLLLLNTKIIHVGKRKTKQKQNETKKQEAHIKVWDGDFKRREDCRRYKF